MTNWHALELKDIFKRLNFKEGGLTDEEVKLNQKKFGLNKLPEEKKRSWLIILANQFKNPLIYILLVAGVICFIFEDFNDFLVILAAVTLNTFIGFFQENQAETSLEKLKKVVHRQARVIRNNRKKQILADNLVPGDLISVKSGDIVPADARLIELHNFQVIEATLTGESLPVIKKNCDLPEKTSLADRKNMIYMGTSVARGTALGVVVSIGLQTELGQIALLLKKTKNEETPLQFKMSSLARNIGAIALYAAFFILIVGLMIGRPFLQMFLTSIAVAVAAVPESLAIGITVALVVGMQIILKNKALVRRLMAAETLGSTTVICSDKTGTLTEGIMRVNKLLGDTQNQKKLIIIFSLCNDAVIENNDKSKQKIFGDPIDQALLEYVYSLEKNRDELKERFPRLDEIPFDSEKMYMATLHENKEDEFRDEHNHQYLIFVKGAPEKIIELSSSIEKNNQKIIFANKEKELIKKEVEDLTQNGARVLAGAYKLVDSQTIEDDDLNDLVFLGLVSLDDPLRKDVKETVKECIEAGIRPIILTGDHKLTAMHIAEKVGVLKEKNEVLEGWQLDKLNKNELIDIVKKVNVYARVEPKHKIAIVEALQSQGEVVAMTGDGVNDAPALKLADIGIALGSGTEVSKEVADIVLLDDNFKTIIKAVEGGRTIFDNIKKMIFYLLSGSFSEIILVGGSLILGLPLPVLPAQILWVNIIEEALPAMAFTKEKTEEDIMHKQAQKKGSLLSLDMKIFITISGVVTSLLLLGLFSWLSFNHYQLAYIRTMMFVALGIDSLFFIFCCKSLRKNIFYYNIFNNKFLNFSVILGFLMYFIAIYLAPFQNLFKTMPLGFRDWIILIAVGLINILLIELGKTIIIFRNKKLKYN